MLKKPIKFEFIKENSHKKTKKYFMNIYTHYFWRALQTSMDISKKFIRREPVYKEKKTQEWTE